MEKKKHPPTPRTAGRDLDENTGVELRQRLRHSTVVMDEATGPKNCWSFLLVAGTSHSVTA